MAVWALKYHWCRVAHIRILIQSSGLGLLLLYCVLTYSIQYLLDLGHNLFIVWSIFPLNLRPGFHYVGSICSLSSRKWNHVFSLIKSSSLHMFYLPDYSPLPTNTQNLCQISRPFGNAFAVMMWFLVGCYFWQQKEYLIVKSRTYCRYHVGPERVYCYSKVVNFKHWDKDKDLFIGPQEFVVGYSKAPEQPQSSARPICHSHAMTRTGREPATIHIAA